MEENILSQWDNECHSNIIFENALLQYVLEEDDYYDDEDDELVEEGANIEYTKTVIKHKRAFKKLIRQAKKDVKKEDFKSAKSNINKARKEIEKVLKDNHSETSSAVFGYFIELANILIPLAIGNIAAIGIEKAFQDRAISAVKARDINKMIDCIKNADAVQFAIDLSAYAGSIGTLVKLVFWIIETSEAQQKDLKQYRGTTKDVANIYRQHIIRIVSSMYKALDQAEKAADMLYKAKKKSVKESVIYNF